MFTITLDKQLEEALEKIARQKSLSLNEVAHEALLDYLESQHQPHKEYSFIGIARSGKRNLSSSVDQILAEGANRRAGWSISE